MRVIKSDGFVLRFWRWFAVYCLDSSPQFGRVYPVVQCLHELSPCISPMFVCCSGDLIVHLLQRRRCGISGSEVVSCSHPFQYFHWNRICINTVLSRGYIFSSFWQFVGSRLLLSLSSISLRYRSHAIAFFKLKLVWWSLGLIVRSICKLMRIGRWSEPRFVFVCELVEVIRDGGANETSGVDGLALPGSLVWWIPIKNTAVGARYHILQ